MLSCFILFDNPIIVGKCSQLAASIHPGLSISKILNAKQISSSSETDILITDEEGHQSCQKEGLKFNLVLILGDKDEDSSNNIIYVNKKFIVTKIGTILTDYIQKQIQFTQYAPLSIKNFSPDIAYPCDLFIRLGQEKYLKIGRANQQIDEKVLQKLIFKGAKYLYLDKNEYSVLLDFLRARQSEKSSQEKESANETVAAVETIHDYILDMGFDPKIVNMTKELHSNIEEKYNQKFLQALFQQFKNFEGSFLYNHSYLTSVIALSVSKRFTWMNYDNREKIYLGSILHDLGFKNRENATFENISKKGLFDLDSEIKDDVLNHPVRFAQKLAQVPEIHQDVIKIVKDHHGIKGEESYPKQIYPNEVNLIFALFCLSHEFSLKLYSISFNQKKIGKILNDIIDEYNRGNFKKIIPEFKQTIEEIFFADK